jgi:glycosyltransferase involved in cell wall biosynthesis
MLSQNKTLLMTVVYPGCEKYLDDFFLSLSSQSYKHYDILILNDGYKKNYPSETLHYEELLISGNMEPSQIRTQGILHALAAGYEKLIFADADDYFSNDRVEFSIDYLEQYAFIYNKIIVVNNERVGTSFQGVQFPEEVHDPHLIIDRNIFGLGHTAINLSINVDFNIPEDILAVDWWLFSKILIEGHKGRFVEKAITYYRQGENNFVGQNNYLDKQSLALGVAVKKSHYSNMSEYCNSISNNKMQELYNGKYHETIQLSNAIKDDSFLHHYLNVVNKNYATIYNGWWSEIISIKELKKYE